MATEGEKRITREINWDRSQTGCEHFDPGKSEEKNQKRKVGRLEKKIRAEEKKGSAAEMRQRCRRQTKKDKVPSQIGQNKRISSCVLWFYEFSTGVVMK